MYCSFFYFAADYRDGTIPGARRTCLLALYTALVPMQLGSVRFIRHNVLDQDRHDAYWKNSFNIFPTGLYFHEVCIIELTND
jgi:hypothetical protein